ncbi:hypothetical protein AAZX31_05G014100 [Glycine max]
MEHDLVGLSGVLIYCIFLIKEITVECEGEKVASDFRVFLLHCVSLVKDMCWIIGKGWNHPHPPSDGDFVAEGSV